MDWWPSKMVRQLGGRKNEDKKEMSSDEGDWELEQGEVE